MWRAFPYRPGLGNPRRCTQLAFTFLFHLRIIAFRFIPNSVVSKPVAAVWGPLVAKPFDRIPRTVKLCLGWLALLGIVFGSAFGFPLPQVTLLHMVRVSTSDARMSQGATYGDRAISVLGLFVFQLGFWLTSNNRSRVPWWVDFRSV